MAISSEQRGFLTRSLNQAIEKFYGDDVPTLARYTNKRRATFIEQLKEKLGASDWYKKIQKAVDVRARKRSALTKVENNYSLKQDELLAEKAKRLAELEAWYKSECQKMALHYDPLIQEKREEESVAAKRVSDLERESYFHGLGEEDDGRRMYAKVTIDDAITKRVDRYIEKSLGDDELGTRVGVRVEQEKLVGDIAYIEKSVETMRVAILRFINSGDLPPITMKAWNIVDGKDELI